ncbi:MAG: replication factor C small subunit [Candidatus Hydrothermarchaeota archaeon]
MDIPWTEKYRPKRLSEIVGQEEIVKRLETYVKLRNLPHLLFAGGAGVGKTTCALVLAREFFGEEWHRNFLELNASDERGIDVVRNKIKDFARTIPLGEHGFKIIFLDESDALTPDAQNALRRTMERYTATCRFILSCNYSSKIIPPIQSRCALFRFRPLNSEDMTKRLKYIAEKEGVKLEDGAIEATIYISEGDMRMAINILQAVSSFGETVNAEKVYEIAGTARPADIRDMIKLALQGNFMGAKEKLENLLTNYGVSGLDVIKQIHKELFNLDIPDKLKILMLDKTGEFEFRLVEGSNERIQLEALLANFALLGKGG